MTEQEENIVSTNYFYAYEAPRVDISFIRFPLGRTVATPKALKGVDLKEIQDALARHAHGDWGDVSPSTANENWEGLWRGCQVSSLYASKYGTPFLIITDADRVETTVLLVSEY